MDEPSYLDKQMENPEFREAFYKAGMEMAEEEAVDLRTRLATLEAEVKERDEAFALLVEVDRVMTDEFGGWWVGAPDASPLGVIRGRIVKHVRTTPTPEEPT